MKYLQTLSESAVYDATHRNAYKRWKLKLWLRAAVNQNQAARINEINKVQ